MEAIRLWTSPRPREGGTVGGRIEAGPDALDAARPHRFARGDEPLANDVGGRVVVPDGAKCEVIDPLEVATVERSKRLGVARRGELT
jgi:hypothetical protein